MVSNMKIFQSNFWLFSFIYLITNSSAHEQPDQILAANKYFDKATENYEKALFDTSTVYYEKASNIYKSQAHATEDKLLWEKHITCLNKIAFNLWRKGERDRSIIYAERAIKAGKEKFGEYYPEVATSYIIVGNNYADSFEFKKARDYYKLAMSIRKKTYGFNHPLVAECYHRFGIIGYLSEDYKNAQDNLKISLDIILNHTPIDSVKLATIYRLMGITYNRAGHFDRALWCYNNEKNILFEIYEPNHPVFAGLYYNIGLIFIEKGDYDTAFEFINQSNDILYINYSKDYHTVNPYNPGSIFYQKGEYDKALQFFLISLSKAKKMVGDQKSKISILYDKIGTIYLAQGEYEKALLYINKSLTYFSKLLDGVNRYCARSHDHLGQIYAQQNKFENALDHYKGSLRIKRQLFGKKHPDFAQSLIYIGELFYKYCLYDSALFYAQKSIIALVSDFNDTNFFKNPEFKNVSAKMNLFSALILKARSHYQLSKFQPEKIEYIRASVESFVLASELTDRIREDYLTESSKIFFTEKVQKIYTQALSTAVSAYKKTTKRSYLESAFLFSEKNKYNILLNNLNEYKARQVAGISGDLLQQERDLKKNIIFYQTEIYKESLKKSDRDSTKIHDFQKSLFILKRKHEKLIAELGKKYPQYNSQKKNPGIAKISDVQKSIDKNSALLEYFVGDTTLYIFCIAPDTVMVTSLAIDQKFFQQIDNYRSSIVSDRKEMFIKSSHYLYEKLCAPAEGIINSKKKTGNHPSRHSFKDTV